MMEVMSPLFDNMEKSNNGEYTTFPIPLIFYSRKLPFNLRLRGISFKSSEDIDVTSKVKKIQKLKLDGFKWNPNQKLEDHYHHYGQWSPPSPSS